MHKITAPLVALYAYVAGLIGRRKVVKLATAATLGAVVLTPSAAFASAPADPLGGAGTDLADSLLTNFTTYVIPAVVGILVAVLAFKLIVKMSSRFLNRA